MENNATSEYTSNEQDKNPENIKIQSDEENYPENPNKIVEIQGQLKVMNIEPEKYATENLEEEACSSQSNEQECACSLLAKENEDSDHESFKSAISQNSIDSICDEDEPLMQEEINEEELFVNDLCDEMLACLLNVIDNNPEDLYG